MDNTSRLRPQHQAQVAALDKLASEYAAVNISTRVPEELVLAAAEELGLQTYRKAGSLWVRGRDTKFLQSGRRPHDKEQQ